MTFNRYYKDELAYLRELGDEFAREHPRLAPFLGAGSHDPDVERLLEGFAFLTGRLREKLDDELPELTHSLMMLLWPHYLRSVPSATILEFTPLAHTVSDRKTIPRGTAVDSRPVDGTRCRFRTCQAVELLPLWVERALIGDAAEGAVLDLHVRATGGASFGRLDTDRLRFHLHGEPFVAHNLFLWLNRYLIGIEVDTPNERGRLSLTPERLRPVGFDPDQALLPYPPTAFAGYRYLQEFFSFPDRFLFVDIEAPDCFRALTDAEEVVLRFRFARPFEPDMRVRASNFRLNCTPAVNLFPHDADPVRLDRRRVEYRIRPQGADPDHYEIHSVDDVEGWVRGSGVRRRYAPFESFEHLAAGSDGCEEAFYRLRTRPAMSGRGLDHFLALIHAQGEGVAGETLSLSLTCCNRHLPEKLRVGDICIATANSPPFATFANITTVTPSVAPPLDSDLHWRLVSNMGLHYLSLGSVDALRLILSTYDFRAFRDRAAGRAARQRLEGLVSMTVEPCDRLQGGLPVRGLAVRLRMLESKFSSEGEMFLFATVLNEFLSLYANVNSFLQMELNGVERGEVYRWPMKSGQQPMF